MENIKSILWSKVAQWGGFIVVGSVGAFLYFLSTGKSKFIAILCLGLGVATFCFMNFSGKKAKAIIAKIENFEGFRFDPRLAIGNKMAVFWAFDPASKKIALVNTPENRYEIKPFSYVLRWYTTASEIERTSIGLSHRPGELKTNVHRELTGFALVLEVADPLSPMWTFGMPSQKVADAWVARIGALINS